MGFVFFNAAGGLYFLFWLAFHVRIFLHAGGLIQVAELFLVLQCALTAFFFVFRRSPQRISWKPYDVMTSILGAGAPFLFLPIQHLPPHWVGLLIQILGTGLTLAALVSLRRSFGILPADRGIQTGGMYRFVRHPVYMSYQIFNLGYLINFLNIYNAAIWALCLLGQVLRVFNEERLLGQNPRYTQYQQRVRWRILPLVF